MTEVAQTHRLTGPYGRMFYDADTQKSTPTDYKIGDMITPTAEELAAHPDRFQEWPPSGTVLAEPTPTEEPPPDEPTRTRSHR